MSWFADLAGKAESLLNNLDEQTGAAIRHHSAGRQKKLDKIDFNIPEAAWSQKKRPIPRSMKKVPVVAESKLNYLPATRGSPSPVRQSRPVVKENRDHFKDISKIKSPARKPYTLNNCPKTLVGDIKDSDAKDHRQRRYSLPIDLDATSNESVAYKPGGLGLENTMLKNELTVMNREVSELLEKLRNSEDELKKTNQKLEETGLENHRLNVDNNGLRIQIEHLKEQLQNHNTVEIAKYMEEKTELQSQLNHLQKRNAELEDILKNLNDKTNEKDTTQIRLETELRHAQTIIGELQSDLERTTQECRRLEKDWESYKCRVKGMLYTKDNEIKALQEGIHLTEDTKLLMEQIDNLKDERETLSEAISRVRGECGDMKQYMETLEARRTNAERIVMALRDALKDERAARTRAEAQCSALAKELKSIQIETGQTIASLRTALRDKDKEVNHLQESTSSSARTSDTSALNVADYDVSQDSIDNEKMYYMTQKLVERQSKIDNLVADNNILKIQLDKLETKYKSEITARAQPHSVVHVQETERRPRSALLAPPTDAISRFTMKMGIIIRRNPIVRNLVILYMIVLHFWVLTVLFTSTPETYLSRPTAN